MVFISVPKHLEVRHTGHWCVSSHCEQTKHKWKRQVAPARPRVRSELAADLL